MIEVKVNRRESHIIGYQITGHAEFQEEGKDIICAAVSALSQTGIFALNNLLGIEITELPREGYLRVIIPEDLNDEEFFKANTICETVLIGIFETAKNYPGYIRIEDQGGEFSWK